jgi:leucyl/phenylalanyl-tRNA--protein transferase
LAAYSIGIFPMADDEGEVHWLAPDPRAIIELDNFHVPRTLAAVIRRGDFDIAVNKDFSEVLSCCADRPEGTWISDDIRATYEELFRLGYAHSVEAWKDGQLAGGLYGVAVGGAFFGESMFHHQTDASKVALVHLVQRMVDRGFTLLDVQFRTDHLARFGGVEIARSEYERRLAKSIELPCSFVDAGSAPPSALSDPNGEGEVE